MGKRPEVEDAFDQVQVDKASRRELDEAEDLHWLMKSVRGRRFLYNLIHDDDKCHHRAVSFLPGADFATAAYNEGARQLGERLLSEIREDNYTLYLKMLEENER